MASSFARHGGTAVLGCTVALWLATACHPASAAAPAPAQAKPAKPAPDATKPDPLKQAFEALPEDQRRALQAALIWTADFNGAVTGSYGPRTRDALLAYAAKAGIAPSAALDARARLLAEAEADRRAVGFTLLRDARAGLRIAVPQKLAPRRSDLADGTRYEAPDGTVVLDTLGRTGAADTDLADMFDRLTRDIPGRRVTYKLARPDFIVVSGETGERKFYARYALGAPALGAAAPDATAIRGFALSYPKDDPGLQVVALAVAASFNPFPASETPPAAAKAPNPASTAVTTAQTQSAIPPAPAAPASAAAPAASVAVGQAVLVAPGLALTRASIARCAGLSVGGNAARTIREDAASGLALVEVANLRDGAPVALATATPDAASTVLFLVKSSNAADAKPMLAVASASPLQGTDEVTAPIQGPGAGVLLVDPAGAMSGLVGDRRAAAVAIGGVLLDGRYVVTAADRVAAFLADAKVPVARSASTPMSAGAAVARWRSSLLPVQCDAQP